MNNPPITHPYSGFFFDTYSQLKPNSYSYKQILHDEGMEKILLSQGNIFPHPNSKPGHNMKSIIFTSNGDKVTYGWFFRGILYEDNSFNGKMIYDSKSGIPDFHFSGTYLMAGNKLFISGYCIVNGLQEYCFIFLENSVKNREASKKAITNVKSKVKSKPNNELFKITTLDKPESSIYFKNKLLNVKLVNKGTHYGCCLFPSWNFLK